MKQTIKKLSINPPANYNLNAEQTRTAKKIRWDQMPRRSKQTLMTDRICIYKIGKVDI